MGRFFTGRRTETDSLRHAFHQTPLYLLPVFASAKDLDNQINHIAGLDQSLLDFLFLLFLSQKRRVLSGGHIKQEIHMMLNDLLQAERLRPAIRHCQHVYTKGILQTRLFVKHVGEIFHVRVFFQFQNDPDPLFGGLIGNIHNVGRLAGLYQRCHIIQEFPDVCPQHGIWNFRNNQLLLSAF